MPPHPESFRALRHLALIYEVSRPIAAESVREALAAAGVTDGVHVEPFCPLLEPALDRPAGPQEWDLAFIRTDRWLDEIEQALSKTGAHPTIHVFARAPLPLLFTLGMRLDRFRVIAYQEARAEGAWHVGTDSAVQPSPEPFFTGSGLPATEVGGRGDVRLAIAVTHPVSDVAMRTLGPEARPLSEVRLTARAGTGHGALSHPAQAAAALGEFRAVLDDLHRLAPGADRVLIGGALPASLAIALGRAMTPRAQHPIVLCNYRDNTYTAVHNITARRSERAPARVTTDSDLERARAVAERAAAVHEDLKRWLGQQDAAYRERFGGVRFLDATVSRTPAAGPSEFDFNYMEGRFDLGTGLLLSLDDLDREGMPGEDLDELLRLFLLHEGHHVQQRLSTYNFQDIGRSSVVLEAIDYDADALAIEACVRRRREVQPAQPEIEATRQVLDCLLRGLVGFDRVAGRVPLRLLPERRLRRYLIWYLQLARARAAHSAAPLSALGFADRPVIEAVHLPTTVEPRGGAFEIMVDLSAIEEDTRGGAPHLDIYLGGRLHRERDTARCRALLAALRDGHTDGVLRAFYGMLSQGLIPTPPTTP